jgi:ComF family protein
MLSFLTKAADSLLHLFFPQLCAACGSDALPARQQLCVPCLAQLPETGFENLRGNPVEKIFYGRLPVEAATALLYFSKDSITQHLLHQVKYKDNQLLGKYLGRLLGQRLAAADTFTKPDALVPVPLSDKRLRERGYNQAELVAQGMGDVLRVPVYAQAVRRHRPTQTQTRKSREERWQNMQEVFSLSRPQQLEGKRVLLIDDVVTTGATLEACGEVLLQAPGSVLQIAAVACTQ